MKRMLAAILAASFAMGGSAGAAPPGSEATVISVTDGDTIVVQTQAGRTNVRLIGIDTPETVDPRAEVECYGPESTAYMQEILRAGYRVYLELDVERYDRYGRLLAYVRRSDGLFINKTLVRRGFARPYPYQPNVRYQAVFDYAARKAQRDNLGLWSHCS